MQKRTGFEVSSAASSNSRNPKSEQDRARIPAHGVWRPDAIRKACADNFNNWYNSNVKDKTHQNFDRAFHVTAQCSAGYKKKGSMLDLLDRPIIGEEAHRQLLVEPDQIDTLKVASTVEEIQQLQMLYQRKQFGHEKHLIWRDGEKLQITEAEVLDTIRKLGTKGKAQSWDNVADVIFSRRALMRVRFNGVSLKEFADGESQEEEGEEAGME